MFTKTLIIVLLGTTLVLAKPGNQKGLEKNGTGLKEKIKEWINKLAETFKELHERARANVEEFFSRLLGIGGKAIEMSKEKVAELKEKYISIIEKAKEAFEKKKKDWEPTLEEWKNLGESALQELGQKAKKGFEEEKYKLEESLKEWNKEVQEALESGKKKYGKNKN